MEDQSLIIGTGLYGAATAVNFINWLDEGVARNDSNDLFPYSAIAARPFYTSTAKIIDDQIISQEFKPRVVLGHRPSNALTEPKISHQCVLDLANFKSGEISNVTLREFQRPLWETQEAYDSAIRSFLEQSDSLSTFHIVAELPDTLLNGSTISIETFILDEVPKAALSVYTCGNMTDDRNSLIFSQYLADYIDQFRAKSSKILLPIMSDQVIQQDEVELAKLSFRTSITLDALSMPYRLLKLSPHSTLDLLRPSFSPLVDVTGNTNLHSRGTQPDSNNWILNSAVIASNNTQESYEKRPFYREVKRGSSAWLIGSENIDKGVNNNNVNVKPYSESSRLFVFPEALPLPPISSKENRLAGYGFKNSSDWDNMSYKITFFGGGLDKNNHCSLEGCESQNKGYLTSSISWIESARLNSELIGRSDRDEWDCRLEILRDIYEESVKEGLLFMADESSYN